MKCYSLLQIKLFNRNRKSLVNSGLLHMLHMLHLLLSYLIDSEFFILKILYIYKNN